MPDLSHASKLFGATIFLYNSVEDAEQGNKFGGSGVLVGVPIPQRPDLVARFAVTNWHVACRGGASVIRLLDMDTGAPFIVEKDPAEWSFIPGKQDIAITPVHVPPGTLTVNLPLGMFILENDSGGAFPGDDVFMAGRFIDYDGHQTNKPALRFGAISMLDAVVEQPTGWRGRSIVVDMHSRTGFSGSPVYVYRQGPWTTYPDGDGFGLGDGPSRPTQRTWGLGNDTVVRLLGIQWGQFPELWEIEKPHPAPLPTAEAPLVMEGGYVRGFSGMSCVCPADQIVEVLHLPELRREWDQPGLVTSQPIPGADQLPDEIGVGDAPAL